MTVSTSWVPQQRVINDAEPDLGIGHIVRLVDHRTIEVVFPAVSITRLYNTKTAPLRRLRLEPGQQAVNRKGGHFKILEVRSADGLLTYVGDKQQLHERDLADQMSAAHAVDQLLAGQLSHFADYGLRRDGWKLRRESLSSRTRGLAGARVQLLPHQLYIAHRIASQELPRVLLADEVGLGKTIEAGLIFCMLRALGRADRVLIVTPRPLLYQWLAEMYRRFNDMFTILNEKRCEEVDEEGLSPFAQTPHGLCSLEFLVRHPDRLAQAVESGWDLLIVDEAHHLTWTPGTPSPLYAAVEALARSSRGLLLLTATPLRSGYTTEFGLLHLVDPNRFSNFDSFQSEVHQLRRLADVTRDLAGDEYDAAQVAANIGAVVPDDKAIQLLLSGLVKGKPGADRALLQALIDRHGTGRVLMRNRRARLRGFPQRVLDAVELPNSAGRVTWLVEFIRQNPDEKVLLIATKSDTVIELQEKLREYTTTSTGLFHEDLSLVERDRQAAWFAEPDGARLLLCSEIGGEGRNFQFAHHLVLWDLPVDPDVLEQRIGRLDRIGQKHDVYIHALYVKDHPSQVVFHWHHEGLNAFSQPVSGAEQVLEALKEDVRDVRQAYKSHGPERAAQLSALLVRAKETRARVHAEVQANVDTLVDLNSYDAEAGHALAADVALVDADASLATYMSRVLERFGVTEDELDTRGRRYIKAGDLMFVEQFPGLPADGGLGATYSRTQALEREDLAFLSRDHPLVVGALGLMLDENTGRASVASCPDVAEKGLIIEFLFILEGTGPAALELSRYLPPTPIEVNLDATQLPVDSLARRVNAFEHRFVRVGSEGFSRYAGWLHEQFPPIVEAAGKRAQAQSDALVQQAIAAANTNLKAEQERLHELRRVNNTVSKAEVDSHALRMKRILAALTAARPRLDAIRLVALPGKS